MKQDISQAELVVMKMLWNMSPLSAQQINKKIQTQQSQRKWGKATVKTLINRLLKKGFIDFEQQGRRYLYYPAIKKENYLATQNDRFLNDFYDGQLSHMMAAFSQHEQLSKAEIKEIKNFIANLEKSHE
jgi:BlaI family penicillinase repressor